MQPTEGYSKQSFFWTNLSVIFSSSYYLSIFSVFYFLA